MMNDTVSRRLMRTPDFNTSTNMIDAQLDLYQIQKTCYLLTKVSILHTIWKDKTIFDDNSIPNQHMVYSILNKINKFH